MEQWRPSASHNNWEPTPGKRWEQSTFIKLWQKVLFRSQWLVGELLERVNNNQRKYVKLNEENSLHFLEYLKNHFSYKDYLEVIQIVAWPFNLPFYLFSCPQLLKVDLEMLSMQSCREDYKYPADWITSRMMCTFALVWIKEKKYNVIRVIYRIKMHARVTVEVL